MRDYYTAEVRDAETHQFISWIEQTEGSWELVARADRQSYDQAQLDQLEDAIATRNASRAWGDRPWRLEVRRA